MWLMTYTQSYECNTFWGTNETSTLLGIHSFYSTRFVHILVLQPTAVPQPHSHSHIYIYDIRLYRLNNFLRLWIMLIGDGASRVCLATTHAARLYVNSPLCRAGG